MPLSLFSSSFFQDIVLWMPVGVALIDAMWTDIRTGIIPHRGPCWIVLWSIAMRYAGKIDLFPLSTIIVGVFFLGISAFFWYRCGKHIMGGGDLKLVMACALMVRPMDLGLWMAFMGIGSLLTNALYRSTIIPMAPATGFSFVLIKALIKH
jgi:Flp pilus assembly protein protease CpaA